MPANLVVAAAIPRRRGRVRHQRGAAAEEPRCGDQGLHRRRVLRVIECTVDATAWFRVAACVPNRTLSCCPVEAHAVKLTSLEVKAQGRPTG